MPGELSAVFRALAADTDQAAGNIAGAMARFTETTAATEDGNVARTLAADAENARAITAIGREPDTLAGGTPAGTVWADVASTPAGAGWRAWGMSKPPPPKPKPPTPRSARMPATYPGSPGTRGSARTSSPR